MKKYGMLFSFTLILSLLIIHAGNVYKGTYVPVSVVKVSPITAESSVYSNNGTVERVDSRNIYAQSGAVVQKIHVKMGNAFVFCAGHFLLRFVRPLSGKTDGDRERD